MRPIVEFLRRNLLLLLFSGLLIGQVAILVVLVGLANNIDHFICGTRSYPCKVIVVPDH